MCDSKKMRALIGTVGSNDLQLDGQTAHQRQQTMREFGKYARDQYQELQGRITAPMLDRAMEYLRDVGELPDQLVLIVTDQPESRPRRDGDTAFAGEVIARRLGERFHVPKRPSIKRLGCVPALIDPVMDQFEVWFPQWAEQYEHIFLMTTGGTPAMSTAMVLVALESCPEKVTQLYAPLGEEVRPTNVLQRTRANQHRHELLTALDHGRFGSAVLALGERGEQLGIADYAHRVLKALVQSADARLRFDLDGARACLAVARREPRLDDELHNGVAALQRSLPQNDDIPGMLGELYHNAQQKLRHGEYADFVLRLFNFQQAALRYAAERAGVEFHRNGEYVREEWLLAHSDFSDHAAHFAPRDRQRVCLMPVQSQVGAKEPSRLVGYDAILSELTEGSRRLVGGVELQHRIWPGRPFRELLFDISRDIRIVDVNEAAEIVRIVVDDTVTQRENIESHGVPPSSCRA